MKRRLLIAGVAALAGCSVLPQTPYLQKRDWPLVVRRPDSLPPRPRGRVLLVRSVQAAPSLSVRGLQSLQPDGSVTTDFYEQWAVLPAAGVEDDLRQWLAASGLFAAVVAPGSRLSADLVLEAELTAFIADPPHNQARAALAVVVLDQRPAPAKILLQRTFAATAPLANADAPAIAAALRAALADVLGQVEDALRPVG